MSQAAFDKNSAHYLLVGVGRRAQDSPQMAVSADDARYLKRALHAFDLFSNENTALTDEAATRKGILEALARLAEQTRETPAGFVLVFFSGHGSNIGGEYYLVCNDTTREDVTGTAIKGSDFVAGLKAIRCNKMLVLLDCCHAEGITEIPFGVDLSLGEPNRVVLTACARHQVSYLSSPVSVFTYAVIEALGGKFLGGKGDTEVTLFNLAMDVRERVVALSRQVLQVNRIQQPRLNVLENSATSNFLLARYPLGGPREIKLFKQEFSALRSYEGKELDMNVANERDAAERDRLGWLQVNTIINSGHGNYIVQGSTINSGLSETALKDILDRFEKKDRLVESLLEQLQEAGDDGSTVLLQKVEKIRSANSQEIKMLENNLSLLVEKLETLTRARIITSNVSQKFELKKEIEQANADINEIKSTLLKLR